MSIPRNLYENFKSLTQTSLVKDKDADEKNIQEFQTILNHAQPADESERKMQFIIHSMYYSNSDAFYDYLSDRRHRCNALILWIDGYSIARFFRLVGVVHISWDKETRLYNVTKYRPNKNRVAREQVNGASAPRKAVTKNKDTPVTKSNVKMQQEKIKTFGTTQWSDIVDDEQQDSRQEQQHQEEQE